MFWNQSLTEKKNWNFQVSPKSFLHDPYDLFFQSTHLVWASSSMSLDNYWQESNVPSRWNCDKVRSLFGKNWIVASRLWKAFWCLRFLRLADTPQLILSFRENVLKSYLFKENVIFVSYGNSFFQTSLEKMVKFFWAWVWIIHKKSNGTLNKFFPRKILEKFLGTIT